MIKKGEKKKELKTNKGTRMLESDQVYNRGTRMQKKDKEEETKDGEIKTRKLKTWVQEQKKMRSSKREE